MQIRPFVIVLATLSVATFPLRAQVPEGHFVVAKANIGTSPQQPGGLYVVHPRSPGRYWQVQNVPPELVAANLPIGTFGGAANVEIRPSDGALIVGELASTGNALDLHILHLDPLGRSVVSASRHLLGTVAGPNGGGQVAQTHVLPNGDVLVGVDSVVSGPLGGHRFGIVSTTGSVTPISVTVPSFPTGWFLNAMTSDGSDIFFATVGNNWLASAIWRVPITGGTATLLNNTLPGPGKLRLHRGNLVAGGRAASGTATTSLYFLDPVTGAVIRQLGLGTDWISGFAIDATSGAYALVSGFTGQTALSVLWADAAGATTVLCSPSAPGWLGTPGGVAIAPNLQSYGRATPVGGSEYRWVLSPGPGGLPLAGNTGFFVRVASTNGPLNAGVWCVSTSEGFWPFLGIELLLNPALVIGGAVVAASATEGDVPLPIPMGVVGRVFLQTVHLTPQSALEASEGLHFTIL